MIISSKFIQISVVFGSFWIQLGYPLIHPIFGTQGLQCDLLRALRPGHSDLFQRSKQGFRSCAGKRVKETSQNIIFDCFCVFSVLMSTKTEYIDTNRTESLSHQPLSFCFCFWGGWLCGGKSLTPAPISGHIGHRIDMDRWVPEVVMRTTSNPTPRWRSDETWMIKHVSLEFSYDMIFWWILSRSFKSLDDFQIDRRLQGDPVFFAGGFVPPMHSALPWAQGISDSFWTLPQMKIWGPDPAVTPEGYAKAKIHEWLGCLEKLWLWQVNGEWQCAEGFGGDLEMSW